MASYLLDIDVAAHAGLADVVGMVKSKRHSADTICLAADTY
jgi:hypothetical protein